MMICLWAFLLTTGCSNMITTLNSTDASEAADALSTDDFTFSGSDNADSVTSDFTVPVEGEVEGTTITWSSSNTSLLSITNGVVTVSQPSDADTEVTLTATITDADGNTAIKTFVITVIASSSYVEANIIYTPNDTGTAMEVTGFESGVSGTVTILSQADGLPVTTIGANAFENLATVTSIALPSSITTIETAAFKNYTGNVTFPSNSTASLTSLGEEAFYGSGLSLIWLSDATGLTSIPDWAFYDCDSLTDYSGPPNLTSIGVESFAELDTLDSVSSIPGTVTSIGVGAFKNSVAITTLDFPSQITDIPDYLATGCTSLDSVTFQGTVDSIGTDAFDNTGLTYFGMYNDTPPTTASADCFTGVSGVTLDVTSAGLSSGLFSTTAPWNDAGIFSSITGNMM